jgi:hypothetical protein
MFDSTKASPETATISGSRHGTTHASLLRSCTTPGEGTGVSLPLHDPISLTTGGFELRKGYEFQKERLLLWMPLAAKLCDGGTHLEGQTNTKRNELMEAQNTQYNIQFHVI